MPPTTATGGPVTVVLKMVVIHVAVDEDQALLRTTAVIVAVRDISKGKINMLFISCVRISRRGATAASSGTWTSTTRSESCTCPRGGSGSQTFSPGTREWGIFCAFSLYLKGGLLFHINEQPFCPPFCKVHFSEHTCAKKGKLQIRVPPIRPS